MVDGRRMAGEAGVTLIESLVSIAILGIAFAVFVGGMFTSILGSDVHRKQATAETVIRQYAEAVKSIGWSDCATSSSFAAAVPSGYSTFTSTVTGVTYWSAGAFVATCPAPDQGLQKVTLRVASNDGRDAESVEIVKRKP
jgi:prepilin-type N-terminal cleavage/methylation domain-containing protein